MPDTFDATLETLDPVFVLTGFALFGGVIALGLVVIVILAVRDALKKRRAH